MKEFAMIAALDEKRGIGKYGTIPWRLKGDMDHFRMVTIGQPAAGKLNAVIMGQATWCSIPEKFRPLPDRYNIVLSRTPDFQVAGAATAKSIATALQIVEDHPAPGRVFVIGGGQVYAEAIKYPNCTTLYLTEIKGDFGCDTFFPELGSEWHEVERRQPVSENGIVYSFVTYRRVRESG